MINTFSNADNYNKIFWNTDFLIFNSEYTLESIRRIYDSSVNSLYLHNVYEYVGRILWSDISNKIKGFFPQISIENLSNKYKALIVFLIPLDICRIYIWV